MNLTKILQQYREGIRGLPNYRECVAIETEFDLLKTAINKLAVAVSVIDNFEAQT